MATTSHKGIPFNWEDPFLLGAQLSEEERMISEAARAFAADRLLPRIEDAYLNETAQFRRLGALRPRPRPGNDQVGLLRDRARDLGPHRLGPRLGLGPGHLLQRAGEDHVETIDEDAWIALISD